MQTGHYGNFPFGSDFATFLESTQQAAGYSASQNKSEIQQLFVRLPDKIKLLEWVARLMKQRDGERKIWISNNTS
jgi:hypothetical protein